MREHNRAPPPLLIAVPSLSFTCVHHSVVDRVARAFQSWFIGQTVKWQRATKNNVSLVATPASCTARRTTNITVFLPLSLQTSIYLNFFSF